MGTYDNPIPKLEKVNIGNNIVLEVKPENASTYKHKENAYFAFIDALGFKSNFGNEEDSFGDVFSYYFELMDVNFVRDNSDRSDWYAGQTSDSLYFYTTRSDFLIKFLEIFSCFNLYAMSKNIFFRGGVAKGDIYYKETHQFYGDVVIKAYLLENNIATYPRIMIDANTYNDIKEDSISQMLIDIQDEENNRYWLSPFSQLGRIPKLDIKNFDLIYRPPNEKNIELTIENNLKLYEYEEKTYKKYIFLMKELKKHYNAQEDKK